MRSIKPSLSATTYIREEDNIPHYTRDEDVQGEGVSLESLSQRITRVEQAVMLLLEDDDGTAEQADPEESQDSTGFSVRSTGGSDAAQSGGFVVRSQGPTGTRPGMTGDKILQHRAKQAAVTTNVIQSMQAKNRATYG